MASSSGSAADWRRAWYRLTACSLPFAPTHQRRPPRAWCGSRRRVLDGQRRAFPDARPVHRGYVDGFWMDRTEVTNEQFAAFVEATGYKTMAERPPDPKDFPGVAHRRCCVALLGRVPPAGSSARPRSAATATSGGRPFPERAGSIPRAPAARSRAARTTPSSTSPGTTPSPTPSGPANACRPRPSGSAPPAAGCERKPFYWGDELMPGGKWLANIWQGKFPCENTAEDGYRGTAPVGSYPAQRLRPVRHGRQRLGVVQPTGIGPATWSITTAAPQSARARPSAVDPHGAASPKRVQRGGSFLCSDRYCVRYRAGGRMQGEPSTGLSHTGFRCVLSPRGKKMIRPGRVLRRPSAAACRVLSPPWCRLHGRAAPPDPGLRVPAGFEVTEFADSKLANDIYCLTLDPQGRVVVSGRGYIRLLLDDDGDGRADRAIDFADAPEGRRDGPVLGGRYALLRRRRRPAPLPRRRTATRPTRPSELLRALQDRRRARRPRRPPRPRRLALPAVRQQHRHRPRRYATLPTSPIKEPVAGCVLRFPPDFEGVRDRRRRLPQRLRHGLQQRRRAVHLRLATTSAACRCRGTSRRASTTSSPAAITAGWRRSTPQSWRLPPYFLDVVAPGRHAGPRLADRRRLLSARAVPRASTAAACSCSTGPSAGSTSCR